MKADDRRRFARRRLARRLVALRPVLIGVAVVAAVGGLVYLFYFSSALAAEKVDVKGTDVLSPSQVRRVAQVPVGDPLARVDTDAVAARVEGLVAVRDVDVSRCWPDAVCIDVTLMRASFVSGISTPFTTTLCPL